MRSEERDLFVYGTLMVPEVMQAVTGRSFQSAPATLTGYVRYRVKHQVYPAIIASEDSLVDGLLYYAIDDDSLQRLDEFESYVYQRREVAVSLSDAAQAGACAYVIAPRYKNLLSPHPWHLDLFKQQHLRAYLEAIQN